MKNQIRLTTRIAVLLLVMASAVMAQTAKQKVAQGGKAIVSEQSVRRYMQALASDEMRGRGSATTDELAAANYIASQLKLLKIEPAGDDGGYLQTVKFMRRQRGAPAAPPTEATTTNVVGILRGSDPKSSKETILLSAHLDHLGIGREVNG